MDKRKDRNTSFIVRAAAMLVMILFVFALTGCDVTVTSLTDEESYEIARYMADKLLQYDRSFGSSELVYIDPTLPTEEPESTEVPVVTPEPADNQAPTQSTVTDTQQGNNNQPVSGDDGMSADAVAADWSEFFTTDEWVITYSSYDTCKSYPKKSDIYQVSAGKGRKLLVISFDVINKTDRKIDVDLTDSGLKYQLFIGEESYSPNVALLANGGLMFLNIELKPYGQDEAVLIFEVPEGADLSTMRLDVSK